MFVGRFGRKTLTQAAVAGMTLWLVSLFIVAARAQTPPPATFSVAVGSAQPGNLFVEGQIVRLSAIVSGASPDDIEYEVRETDGLWSGRGKIPLSGGKSGEYAFTLSLPGRGLYELIITARAGGQRAQTKTRVGVTFAPVRSLVTPTSVTPLPTFPAFASRWGVFTIPYDGPHDSAKAAALAQSQWLLGAKWSRLNFWHFAFEDLRVPAGENPQISVNLSKWKGMAQTLHRQGIAVMGEFAEMPRVLSSRPDETQKSGEGAAIWARVPPKDYRLWEQLVERTAREFRDEISYWEVWNEPDGDDFWQGTPEEFAELIRHTARAVRRGNPAAKIVASGFTTSGVAFFDRVLSQKVASEIDVFSFHAEDLAPFRAALVKHGVSPSVPLWGTEEHELIGLRGMKEGYAVQFHFFHQLFGANYDNFPALVDRDLTPLPDGMAYATAAHVIGEARVIQAIDTPEDRIYLFRRGNESIAVWKTLKTGLLAGSLTLAVKPLPGKTIEIVDAMGRARPVKPMNNQVTLPITGLGFLRGAAQLRVVNHTPPKEKPDPAQFLFPATSGKWTEKWGERQPGKQNPPPSSDVTRPFLTLYAPAAPKPEIHSVEIPFVLPKAGRYRLLFLGITTQALIPANRWASPFAWRMDGGEKTVVDGPLTSYYRESSGKRQKNERVPAGDMVFTGGPDIYQELGVVSLSAGAHVFRLELTAGRLTPDNADNFFFEGVALRPEGQ